MGNAVEECLAPLPTEVKARMTEIEGLSQRR